MQSSKEEISARFQFAKLLTIDPLPAHFVRHLPPGEGKRIVVSSGFSH